MPLNTRMFLWSTLLVLLTGLGHPAYSGEPLTVGISEEDYVPFYFEEEGVIKGAAAEVAITVAEQLGHVLRFERFPWRRVQRHLETGRIDMVILYFKTDDREEHAVYADIPHIHESSSLFVLAGSTISFDGDITALAQHRFGNVAGYWHGKAYTNNTTLTKFAALSSNKLIDRLLAGQIDIAVGNKPVILALADKLDVSDRLKFLEPKIDYAPDYIAFSRSRGDAPQLAGRFSDQLRSFMKSPLYSEIMKKYRIEIPAS